MTTRTDVVQDFANSPRVQTVAAPSVEYIVQDVVDTTREFEDGFRGMSELKLLDASGKEELGGGIQVAITANLQNNQIEFEARRTPAESGTISTQGLTDARGLVQLIDASADFIAAGVQPGSFVINFTDQSITDVRRVVSSTQLECKALVNGTDDQFDVSDVYQVFNVIQCSVLGGNLVATDDMGGELSPILPSAFTQIILSRSSTGTSISEALSAVWDAQVEDYQVAGSFGEYVRRKLLSVTAFLGLK